jgi:integrase
LAAGITRVKGAKSKGVRVGNWLSVRQAQTLLNAPDISRKKGLRDRAMLAILLGCGLRRSEVAALTLKHIQQRDNRWCIVDLVGKHGRVRTVPMPTWTKVAVDAWTEAAGVAEGHVLRRIARGDQVRPERMSEKVVWQLLQPYAAAVGVPGIAPPDLRRTCAKMSCMCSVWIPPGSRASRMIVGGAWTPTSVRVADDPLRVRQVWSPAPWPNDKGIGAVPAGRRDTSG